jgi:GTP-binding protein Era
MSMSPRTEPDTVPFRAGHVAIVGRPNAGKSTLLNALMGVKLSIVSPRPQTTRNRIAGIKTVPGAQFVFLDTPGIHDASGALGRRLVHTARTALADADVALLVVDSRAGAGAVESEIAALLTHAGTPIVIGLNKMDLVARPHLLPLMAALSTILPGCEIVPVNARDGQNVDTVIAAVRRLLPVGPQLYPEDEMTDQSERFIAQEIIREKVFTCTRDEIPYASAVITEEFCTREPRADDPPLLYVRATVLVARPSQKPIVIGRGGQRLKDIGQQARLELERFFGRRIFLQLYVKVEKGWDANPAVLRQVGL